MDKGVALVLIAAVFVIAMAGMFLGWRARGRRQSHLVPERTPVLPEADRVSVRGLYVATTLSGQPLERVTVHGLGFRSRMTAAITESGIVLALTGQEPILIRTSALAYVGRATWTIDAAVEKGGLVVLSWRMGAGEVETYLRLDGDPEEFISAGKTLVKDHR